MKQSRAQQFYGEDRLPDTYEGRVEVLTLHMSVIMARLNDFGESGEILKQALFDVMVYDFDDALRNEGLSDSGVSRRIKAIVRLFYTRLKSITHGLHAKDIRAAFVDLPFDGVGDNAVDMLEEYTTQLWQTLSSTDIDSIADADFRFPAIN